MEKLVVFEKAIILGAISTSLTFYMMASFVLKLSAIILYDYILLYSMITSVIDVVDDDLIITWNCEIIVYH